MAYNRLPTRVCKAVRDAIAALNLPGGFVAESIVVRSAPVATAAGLKTPAIVVAPGKISRKAGYAGLRVRSIAAVVSIYFLQDGDGTVDADLVENVSETIQAAFDLPVAMPAALAALAEVEEVRVAADVDRWLPAAWKYYVAAQRFAVLVETCQASGVVA